VTEKIHEASLGETINGFYLQTQWHKSLLCTLYRVTHPDHDLAMVMKVPKLDVILPPSAYAGFETEVRILSRLRGVYTPRVVGKGDMATCPYIVMEYIEGDAILQATNHAPVTVARLVELLVPLCKAIHELHQHNIIHLDIKPENIRNREDGQAVIIDFGSAHHTLMPDMYIDSHEMAPRTPDYVAPEQIQHIRNEFGSDIYALGIIMYQLATGKFPFAYSNQITLYKKLYLPPTPPRVYDETLPPWLQEVILRCLQRHPHNRFTSAKQLAYMLLHPHMIKLSRLAELKQKPGLVEKMRFWFAARRDKRQSSTLLHPRERIIRVHHVLVALDLSHSAEELKQALHTTLQRLARSDRQCFFTVLSVIESNEFSFSKGVDEENRQAHSTNIHCQIELRHWMKTLNLAKNRVNYQVIEGTAASEIIGYARHHLVDHIIIGARGSSTLRRYLGSVSSKVVAEAPCSVTVVRTQINQSTKEKNVDPEL